MAVKSRSCEVCKQELEFERAEADKQTRLCVKHARAIEKYGGEFIGTGQYGSQGKQESIRKSYGGVSVNWQRNEEGLRMLIAEFDEEQARNRKR